VVRRHPFAFSPKELTLSSGVPSSPMAPFLRGQRVRMARPYLRGRVLDYGCSSGHLAELCRPDAYLGVDISEEALEVARASHPGYQFDSKVSEHERFDAIVALAVLEHVHDPLDLLTRWAGMLNPGGRIVLTTPHPSFEWILTVGAKVGLFDRHSLDEHDDLLNLARIRELAAGAGLELERYRRFLLGANQLFVLRPGPDAQ
jgi:2-polyprenyl-3-methyl-5-hydroxy-6-metoxy-1,4-benzoquinol methylase